MQSNLFAPLPPLSLLLPLSLSVALFLLSKICHIKKNTHRGRNSTNEIYNNESTVWREHQEHQERTRERERSALPCRRRKSFVLPSPRVASALLGCCCCCCCWSLRTATAAAAVQFCFQRRHDWTRALQESRSRTLNSTELSSTTTLCVCVSLCTRVCAYVSRCCVCPSRQCRKKL